MPPTRHMTGDVFRGYLLDGFFNLAGAMTDQGILLVGMMTEAVVTPWLSDRDLALQNVRYVLNAAGRLPRTSAHARTASSPTRARQVLGEAVDLLEQILDHEQRAPRRDRRRHLRPDEAPGRRRQGPRGRRQEGDATTTTRPPRSWRRDGASRGSKPADDKTIVRPYGDTTGDGMVQVSFTLPIPHDKRAEGAAAQLANKMGMDPALVVHAKAMGPDFTFFVVYGRSNHLVDLSKVEVVERDYPLLTPKEVNLAIKKALRRRLVVVGACIGTDAHTVGIDAILNIKGFAGEKGLEYYRELKVVNLGAQVSVPELVARAREEKADAVLVSQVVTQRDAHLLNTKEMSAAFREAYPAGQRPLLIVGGPRFEERQAGRPRRRPGLQPGHHPRRGGELPRARAGRPDGSPPHEQAVGMSRRPAPRAHGDPPPLRAVLPRPLRRQPGRRRLRPRPVRRRRHRGLHPHRRRRGTVRVVLRRAVPGAGPGRRRGRGRGRR